MFQVFVTPPGELRKRWREAFPQARVAAEMSSLAGDSLPAQCCLWLDLGAVPAGEREARVSAARGLGRPVIAMVSVPQEGEAFLLLSAGLQGYCHVEAAPDQLREIARVVERGGLWMPPELLQRFLSLSTRVVPSALPEVPELNDLTSRELMVAEQVARGASNREIAEALEITERTVKAHLSAIFEKLEVRDRVQLALKMNNIPTYSTVN
jgi:DNA-binding NarL/FixJ family response regulator